MARTIYPKGAEAILTGTNNLSTANLRLILVDAADYTYSALHDNLDDVAAGARVAVSGNLASVTVTDGVLDATSPVTITGVSGDVLEAVILYVHTGTESTSTLLTYIDQESDNTTAISFTPNGSDVDVTFTNLMDLVA